MLFAEDLEGRGRVEPLAELGVHERELDLRREGAIQAAVSRAARAHAGNDRRARARAVT